MNSWERNVYQSDDMQKPAMKKQRNDNAKHLSPEDAKKYEKLAPVVNRADKRLKDLGV